MKKIFSNLSKTLRKELRRRALPLRKGDKVRVMRGNFKGKEAKVISVDRENGKVYLENLTKKKADGTEKNIAIDASKLQIIEYEAKDEERIKIKGAKIKAKEPKAKEEKKITKKENLKVN